MLKYKGCVIIIYYFLFYRRGVFIVSMLNLKKEENEYLICDGDTVIHRFDGELGVSYNYWKDSNGESRGFLYKYGASDDVKDIHDEMISKLDVIKKTAGSHFSKTAADMIEQSYYVSGHFDLEELNKCLSISDYVVRLHENGTFEK